MASELVCGADFSCKLMCGAGPGDQGGSRGSDSAENHRKTGPKISSQTAFRYPGQDLPDECFGVPQADGLLVAVSHAWRNQTHPDPTASKFEVICLHMGVAPASCPFKGPPGPLKGHRGPLKDPGVLLETFGPVFLEISAETDSPDPP